VAVIRLKAREAVGTSQYTNAYSCSLSLREDGVI
jgi:hypothetical protein